MSRYVEFDMEIIGIQVPRVRFLITKNPNRVLDPKHNTKLPGFVEWKLVKLACQEFNKKHTTNVFEKFESLDEVDPLLFSQFCIYYTDNQL